MTQLDFSEVPAAYISDAQSRCGANLLASRLGLLVVRERSGPHGFTERQIAAEMVRCALRIDPDILRDFEAECG